MLTDQEIRDMCKQAERVVITGESTHKEVGMKVGLFAQTASISWQMDRAEQEHAVKTVLRDLIMMNKREEYQQQQAKKVR